MRTTPLIGSLLCAIAAVVKGNVRLGYSWSRERPGGWPAVLAPMGRGRHGRAAHFSDATR